jgi:hypothetical protein
MTALSPTFDQSYTIANTALAWSILGSSVTNQVPACGYTYKLTSLTTSTIVTATPGATILFSVYSRDLTNAGTFPISVTATLSNYPYSAPSPPCQSTFTLTVIDPCISTSITYVPVSIENLVAFAGYNITSHLNYTFNDTVSFSTTQTTDSMDFCGDKQLAFKLNGTSTTYLYGNNSDYLHMIPPTGTIDYGSGLATVQARMKNYPSIVSNPIRFTFTILGSTVPTIND